MREEIRVLAWKANCLAADIAAWRKGREASQLEAEELWCRSPRSTEQRWSYTETERTKADTHVVKRDRDASRVEVRNL
jgi:hypothetical protein